MSELPATLHDTLRTFPAARGTMVVMTGAGISAESGIPTFRGKEGYWTIGSQNYLPEEMATAEMFGQHPEAVWAWYLYRRGVCHTAQPNPGHAAVVRLELALGDRFLLITQNVDGLHLRAGSSPGRTYEIHGNIDFARCWRGCRAPQLGGPSGFTPLGGSGHAGRSQLQASGPQVPRATTFALPELPARERAAPLTAEERALLRCPSCGDWARPHVLWFDEYYDEEHFRFQSSLHAAAGAAVLLVVGTSGATNLPQQVGQTALDAGATIVDINPEANPFSRLAQRAAHGHFLQGAAGDVLPRIAAVVEQASAP